MAKKKGATILNQCSSVTKELGLSHHISGGKTQIITGNNHGSHTERSIGGTMNPEQTLFNKKVNPEHLRSQKSKKTPHHGKASGLSGKSNYSNSSWKSIPNKGEYSVSGLNAATSGIPHHHSHKSRNGSMNKKVVPYSNSNDKYIKECEKADNLFKQSNKKCIKSLATKLNT